MSDLEETHYTDLMIDFKTLGGTPNSAVISLGATLFNRHEVNSDLKSFYILLKPDVERRDVEPRMLGWWFDKPLSAQKEVKKAITQGVSSSLAIEAFSQFLKANKFSKETGHVWGLAASFDLPILDSLCRETNSPELYSFRNIRCLRTLYGVVDFPKEARTIPAIAHHSQHRSSVQAIDVRTIYNKFKGRLK